MPQRMGRRRRRLPRLLLNAATATSVVLSGPACNHAPRGGPPAAHEPPPRAPATRPLATVPPSPAGLLERLNRYGAWEGKLARMADVRARRRVSAADRDAHFAEISRLAVVAGGAIEVMVVESLIQGQSLAGEYDRIGLFHVPGRADAVDPAAFERLGLVRVGDPGRWRQLARWGGQLLADNAPFAPERRIFDVDEAAIVSRFDGRGWTSRCWFNLLTRAELGRNPQRPEDLPPESRAAVNLFQLVDRSLTDAHPRRLRPQGILPADEDPPRFAGFSAEFVDKFGEFPVPPAPR
jgi:hypothetical protein